MTLLRFYIILTVQLACIGGILSVIALCLVDIAKKYCGEKQKKARKK